MSDIKIIYFLKKCFNFSDEEEEDQSALIYLPMAPDIDEPEIEGTPPVAPQVETPSKSRRPKTIDIDLKEAPKDGLSQKVY